MRKSFRELYSILFAISIVIFTHLTSTGHDYDVGGYILVGVAFLLVMVTGYKLFFALKQISDEENAP